MKYFVIICLVLLSCTDDRSLDYNDFKAAPKFEFNLLNIEYSAASINAVNNSISFDIGIDFLNEELNRNNLETLEFKFQAENTIDQEQEIKFVFLDINGDETFSIEEFAPVGSPDPKEFTVTPSIDDVTRSVGATITISQPSTATNYGSMHLECIVIASYLYTGE